MSPSSSLLLTEEQALLRQTVVDFAAARSPVSRLRELRTASCPAGYSRALWTEMAKMGLTGVTIDERYGGMGLGLFELVLVLEGAGRTLMPEPLLSTAVLGASLMAHAQPAVQGAWLPRIAAGSAVFGIAFQEANSRYDVHGITTRATPSDGGYELTGSKVQAWDAIEADALLVTARLQDGATGVFLVDPESSGLQVTAQQRVDGRNAALVRLDGVNLDHDALILRDSSLLDAALDTATVALSAEMLGAARQAFDMTLTYLKERRQFGVAIGSFQALQHRAAQLYIELELARSAVLGAAREKDSGSGDFAPRNDSGSGDFAPRNDSGSGSEKDSGSGDFAPGKDSGSGDFAPGKDSGSGSEKDSGSGDFAPGKDSGSGDSAALASLAKALCSDVFVHVTNEGVQMFGGVGMTDEYDIGLYMKRARAAAVTLGDATWHRARWAELRGY